MIGRGTYDVVRGFDRWYYGSKPVILLTTRPVELPDDPKADVTVLDASPREVVEHAAAQGWGHLYIDGGKVIQSFLAEGLIDRLVLTRLPILIGTGIPLFGPLPGDVRLRHVSTRTFRGGAVQTEYEVAP